MFEFDHPHILLADSSSMFHQMVQRLGDVSYKTLCEQALTSFSALRNLEQGDNLRGKILDSQSGGGGHTNLGFEQENDPKGNILDITHFLINFAVVFTIVESLTIYEHIDK